MTKTKLLSTSEALDRDGAADLLNALAERLRGGTVLLESATDSVTVQVPEGVTVDVDLTSRQKSAGTKVKIDVEIEWYEGADAVGGASGPTLPEPGTSETG